ncbi:ABC transporter ATP-binding protein [Desulfococcus multivorans]|uniref:ABC transporter related protein n=1 Tax=Desulfococcus multivorans DSM 2059 TaxID=1121405 RepID=S7USR5_DESML|nr:ABC transporter ATP-binding protein [Desulfococcus multivorans]AOY58668.1 LolD: lipoprotein-releasing system ATP-binding protein [Desulfococcus multivorans]AQV00957.1 ABC transporter ATP-binding protein [Desulfococcus multivorans]EPR35323.1 ABC transporter related protein [Desulfococcus multivorans DSM 2059]SJZ45989.1 lipoprotein-releasing system ATP-binding protein [Desulfococcus multivorans DSM 2059]
MVDENAKRHPFIHETPLVQGCNIHKGFNTDNRRIEVLTGLNFILQQGETVAVTGPSGIGKSTLLHILGTLDRPDHGTLLFNGENVFRFNSDRLAAFRNASIGFVFQFHHLLAEFSALENAMMPLLINGRPRGEAEETARKLLVRVGLDNRLTHRVNQLSGGEQQRVALARALVLSPALLLADEPTGNLDKKNSEHVHELLYELNRELGMTLVVVTHSTALAAYMRRRVTLSEGRLMEEGKQE